VTWFNRAVSCGAICVALAACRGSGPAEVALDAGARAAAVSAEKPPVPEAPKPRPKAPRAVRVKAVSAPVDPVVAGARLTTPQAFVVPDGADLTLDFEHGARVHVVGPAEVLVDLSELDLMLVRRGAVSIDLSPSAPTPTSGFTLVTPAAQLSLLRGGRFVARVFEQATYARVVSGTLTLAAVRSSPAPERPNVLLGPGDALVAELDSDLKRTKHTLPTLEQAEAAVLALRVPKPLKDSVATRLDPLIRSAIAALAGPLARQQGLTAQHRALLQTRDADTLGLQREVAENAVQVATARAQLRLALAQRAAQLQTPLSGSDDTLSQEATALLQH
jgi:hypothetical protein